MQSWQHQRICTLCQCHVSTISSGVTLCKSSLCTSSISPQLPEIPLPPCRLTTFQVCQACKDSLSPGQQDDRCQLMCPSYAQTRPANVPVSWRTARLSFSDDIYDRPETVYFQVLPGSCSSNHIGEATTFPTAFSVRFSRSIKDFRRSGLHAFRPET